MAFQENANLALFQVFHGGKGRISGYGRTPVQHFQVVPFLRGLSQTTLTPKLFRMFSASSPKTILWPPTQICGNPTPPPPASAGHHTITAATTASAADSFKYSDSYHYTTPTKNGKPRTVAVRSFTDVLV